MNKFVLITLLIGCIFFVCITAQAESVSSNKTQVYTGGIIKLDFNGLVINNIYKIYAENVINRSFMSDGSNMGILVFIPISLNVTLLLFELYNNNVVVDTYLITIINEGHYTNIIDSMSKLFPYYALLCLICLSLFSIFDKFKSDNQKELKKKVKEMLICNNCLEEYNKDDKYCYNCGNKL